MNPFSLGASVDDFVDLACPKMPPPPPGWVEWWEAHRSEVRTAIAEAQESVRRTIEFRYLKTLDDFGMLKPETYRAKEITIPGELLKELRDVVRVDAKKVEESGDIQVCGRACGKQGCDERCVLPPDHDGYCSCRR